jgi:hypothetical protein
MENNLVVILPEEVKQLAERVSAEKQQEVNTVLNQVFANTADWEAQVDAIEVKGITDRVSMQMADVARVNAKKARLNAEKIFDAKREEVQHRMASDKTEDALWLKAKQITQIKLKAIEEKAEWKANFVKRHEAEQRALIAQIRFEKAIKFSDEITLDQVASMTDQMFDMVFTGLEKTYNDKIEADAKADAKAEAEKSEYERVEKLRWFRSDLLRPYYDYFDDVNVKLGLITDSEFEKLFSDLNNKKIEYEEKQGRVKAENERLKKEAEEKEAALKIERETAEMQLRALEIVREKEREAERIKQSKILADQKAESDRKQNEYFAKAEKERKEAEIKAQKEKEANDLILANERKIAADKLKAEKEMARIATEKANAEKKEAELKAAEWKAKVDAQIKASNDKIEKEKAEQKAKEEQERQNAMAGDKVKLTKWVNSIVLPDIILLGLDENSIATINVITSKFEGFKKWADSQIAAIK